MYHQLGNLRAAERDYRSVLHNDPTESDAQEQLHLVLAGAEAVSQMQLPLASGFLRFLPARVGSSPQPSMALANVSNSHARAGAGAVDRGRAGRVEGAA